MHFKLKNLENEFINHPWFISAALHGLFLTLVCAILLKTYSNSKRNIDFEVIESPKLAQQSIEVSKPQPKKKAAGHEVFGLHRKTLTSNQGEDVKVGNTLAKAPDQEKLRDGDADQIPIPSAEYLITQMPQLKSDVRIPYPPDSKKSGVQGAVIMDLLIDASGKVREVTLLESPNLELGEAAKVAARNFEFSAALIDEKPVTVRIRYTYRFVLEH